MSTDWAFLGTGWSFPPTFQAGGQEVEMVSGVADIHQSLKILLTTRLGERVMHEEFGCDMTHLLFEEVNQDFINTLTSLVTNAILLFEPRIKLNGVAVLDSDIGEGRVMINIDYTVPSVNSRFNMVFPFYLTETTFLEI